MVDSVKYWFEEYKIDGMRWDMMGDATADAVQHAYDAAAAVNRRHSLLVKAGEHSAALRLILLSLVKVQIRIGWTKRIVSVFSPMNSVMN